MNLKLVLLYGLWPLYWLKDRIKATGDMRLRKDGTRDMGILSKYSPVISFILIALIWINLRQLFEANVGFGGSDILGAILFYAIGIATAYQKNQRKAGTEEALSIEILPFIQIEAICLVLIIWFIL